jgi:hypothetical protein
MKLERLNAPLLVKLLQLDRHAGHLAELAEAAERELAYVRNIINGGDNSITAEVFERERANFDGKFKAAKRLRAVADTEQRVLSNAKIWLERLPSDSELDAAETVVGDGLQLDEVRRRKQAVADEITALRAVPVPSPDIRERVEGYVRKLAHAGRPDIDGVVGGELKVYWPADVHASRQNHNGFTTDGSGSGLLVAAYLFPERLTEALMASIEQATSKPMPPAARLQRLRELAGELVELSRVEAALVDAAIADGAHEVHDINAAPEVVLGCRIRAAASAAA